MTSALMAEFCLKEGDALFSAVLFLGMMFALEDAPVKAVVKMERPERHYYQVEMTFPAEENQRRELKMAVWTPGSYKVRDFARNVEQFQAFSEDGTPLSWQKIDKSTWVVAATSGAPFKITYQVFADELSVRTSYLDSFRGAINPASVFFYEPTKKQSPIDLNLSLPKGWSAACAMQERGPNRYQAANWDNLVDSPILVGALRRHDFEVRDIPHYWVVSGEVDMNETEMVESMRKIGETVGDIFGAYPFSRYYFLSHFELEGAGGGLEHANSTLVHGSSMKMRTQDGWEGFLGLLFHEYFHAWNVKAIHDEVLGPFDYQQEVYTDLLWLHEGWTSYYNTILMGRAGFWDEKKLVKKVAEKVDRYLKSPGIDQQSLMDASFNAWIHQYQPTNASRNARVSYYPMGAMSGLAMDLLIRHKTRNKANLDDVLRRFYRYYALQGRSITWEDVELVLGDVGGKAAQDFLDKHIREANPLPLETCLGYAGLKLVYEDDEEKKPEDKGDEKDQAKAKPFSPNPKVSMGIDAGKQNGAMVIHWVRKDGAGWDAGLAMDDEILAFDNLRVTPGNYESLLGWHRPGDVVRVLVNRGGKLIEKSVKLQAKPKKLKLVREEEPSSLQNLIYDSLFSVKAPEPGVESGATGEKAADNQ